MRGATIIRLMEKARDQVGDSKTTTRIVDLTGPPEEEPHNPSYVPALDLDCTTCDGCQLTLPDTSNGLDTTGGHGRSGGQKDVDFPSVGELLRGAGETRELQRTGPSDGQATGGSEGDSEYDSDAYEALRNQPPPQFRPPPILDSQDRNNRASSIRNKPGSPGDPIVVKDDDIDSSGDDTSEEQVGNLVSLETSPTSVGGSEPRSIYLNLHENSEPGDPHTSPSNRNTLSSTLGRSKGGNRKGLTQEDQERHDRDGDKKTAPSLASAGKRLSSAVVGTSASKRRRYLSPEENEAVSSKGNIFTVPEQDLDTQPDGTSPESKDVQPKLHNTTIPRSPASGTATSPPTLAQAHGHSDGAQAEKSEWEIEEILGERDTVSGKEYMVSWKKTWLPEDELGNAGELLRKFKAKGRVRRGRKRGRPAGMDKVW
ncbi:hypothetical protein OEA41_008682 [Lepraria neglecta]|uniref:Chromo domain-containing protein n=1 Tax=Lepraria neglecta TaxID=209136 RepID=A0AAE0DH53_9LECA|nr:hypothetical protein OEA41_008682 [Lepraria neglecta]